MSSDDVLPKWQIIERSAPLMLNGDGKRNNVGRPYGWEYEFSCVTLLALVGVTQQYLSTNEFVYKFP
ncbi:unnamed protein product [Bubo scandiacus]